MVKNGLEDQMKSIEFAWLRNVVYLCVFFLSLYYYINCPPKSDLFQHLQFVELLDQGKLVVPHFLFHVIVFALSKITSISFHYVACLVLSLSIVASLAIIERIVRAFLAQHYSDFFLLFISVSLIFVSAVFLPLINPYPYKGVWSPNPWHNPTYIMVKPFVLLSFFWYILEVDKEQPFQKRFSLIRISLLLGISCFIKPNFVLAFFPMSVIYCFFSGRAKLMLFKTALLLLPILPILIFQYLFTYYNDVAGDSSIRLCVFDVWRHHARSVPIAIVQSIAFPLVVLIIRFRQLLKEKAFFISWLLFILGLFIFGFLNETGGRKSHANFCWTYMFCLNVLFIYSTVVFLQWSSRISMTNRLSRLQLSFCSIIFLLHLFSGLYYIGYLISGHHF
jgi:hypothetical protein